jgi:kynurenine formamidase
MTHGRWMHRPEGSNWGDFGENDQLGRLNLITPAKVLEGVAEVKEGRTFCLSLPLDLPGGSVLSARRHPPSIEPTLRDGQPNVNFPMNRVDPRYVDLLCDDKVTLCTQYSTQWDALGHVGAKFDADGDGIAEGRYYNGYRADTDVRGPARYTEKGQEPTGGPYRLGALGIEHMAVHGIQGRGVMVDLHAHFGRTRARIGAKELADVLEKDKVIVEPGDILCLHTGFDEIILEAKGNPDPAVVASSCCVLDGRDDRLAQWITHSGIAAIACDNFAIEAVPAPDPDDPTRESFPGLPLHHHCLFKLGLPFGELWYLREIAQWLRGAGRSRFLLTAPPLRLPGAAGSPVTPIATV